MAPSDIPPTHSVMLSCPPRHENTDANVQNPIESQHAIAAALDVRNSPCVSFVHIVAV